MSTTTDSYVIETAAAHGRTVADGARVMRRRVTSARGAAAAKVGTVSAAKDGRRYMVLTSEPARYHSEDYIDDMDLNYRPGWYREDTVIAVEPTAEELAADRAADQSRQAPMVARIRGTGEIIPIAQCPGCYIRVSGSPEQQAYIRAVATRARLHCGHPAMADADQYDAEVVAILRAYWDQVAPGWTHRDGKPVPDADLVAMHQRAAVARHLDADHTEDTESAVIDVAKLESRYALTDLRIALGL